MEKPSGVKTEIGVPCTLLGALVFLAAFSAHGWLIDTWGSPLPFWDQWDAEALRLYLPFERGTLQFADFWLPHNEHRAVLTHLQNLLLIIANGRWDPLMQMVVNALWHGLTALVVWSGIRRTEIIPPALLVVFVVALFGAPFGWQNALWGFQSTSYFTLLLGLVFSIGILLEPAFSRQWWLACVAGAILPLSSGSAPVFPLATLLALLISNLWKSVESVDNPDRSRRFVIHGFSISFSQILSLVACMVVAVATGLMRADAPHHAPLFAKTAEQFFHALACSLAWPNIDIPATVVVVQLPWVIWLAWMFRRRPEDSPALRITLWCGLLASLHAASIAYARGGGLVDGAPLSRYQEPLLLGALANLLALAHLRRIVPADQLRRWKVFAALWTLVFASGLIRLSYTNFGVHLPFKSKTDRIQIENLQAYVASRDPSILADKSLWEISHTDVRNLRAVLDSNELAPRLPAALKPGTPLTALERATRGVITFSPALFVLSIVSLAIVLFRAEKNRRTASP